MRGLLLVLLALCCAGAARAQCNPLGAPAPIDVAVLQPDIVYHHDVDLAHLQAIGNSAEQAPRGWTRLGVTVISSGIDLRFVTDRLRVGGVYCLWVTKVTGTLGSADMNVYVASNYPEGSCEYAVVLAHENAHVRLNLQTLIDWIPRVRDALVTTVDRKFPMVSPAAPTAAEVRAFLLAGVSETLDQMNRDMAERNAYLDTPANYQRTAALCRNW